MDDPIVERSVWIGASPEQVWDAISKPEQIAQWFMPPAMGAQMKLDDRGVLSVGMGPMDIEIAVVEQADAPHRLTCRSLPDRMVTTTYDLHGEDGGTRVTVTMRGLDRLPDGARRERVEPSGAGWEKALRNLKAYVDGQPIPFPEGWVTALFGYRIEGTDKLAVERSIWIGAPRERVWQAITVMDQMERWFSPGTPWQLSAMEVGGRFYVYDEATGSENYTQVIDLIDPPHRFVTRSAPQPPEVPFVSDWRLEPADGGTRLTITHSGYQTQAGDERHNSMEQNAFGFGMMLQNLKAYVEGEPLPVPGGF